MLITLNLMPLNTILMLLNFFYLVKTIDHPQEHIRRNNALHENGCISIHC